MYTYRDYFPRRILRECGVSPDKPLNVSVTTSQTKADRVGDIKKSMHEVYSTFEKASKQKADISKGWIEKADIDRRILSAFYDMDILQEADREIFPEGYKISNEILEKAVAEKNMTGSAKEERLAIEVPETEDKNRADMSPKEQDAPIVQMDKTL